MDCEIQSVALRERLRRKAATESVPLIGMLELTRRCNFKCAHCYAGPASHAAGELKTEEWKGLMDEAAAAGCLELVFSGGEPLLRSDFAELYIHARRLGMEVTVFTNASLVDEQMASLFNEWPARKVEVSVYGITEPTARAVTGVDGACARQWDGIRKMMGKGIPVSLKLMAIKPLRHEIEAIEARARDAGLELRFSTEILPRLDGDLTPLSLTLDPQEVASLEARLPGWADALRKRAESRQNDVRRYPCAAGQYGFFIDAGGFLQPCIALTRFRKKIGTAGLKATWKEVSDSARSKHRKIDRNGTEELLYKSFVCIGFTEWGGEHGAAASGWTQLAKARKEKML
jgi:MoaA/NifB/PqqE/SkfB family radical SAM enzyme